MTKTHKDLQKVFGVAKKIRSMKVNVERLLCPCGAQSRAKAVCAVATAIDLCAWGRLNQTCFEIHFGSVGSKEICLSSRNVLAFLISNCPISLRWVGWFTHGWMNFMDRNLMRCYTNLRVNQGRFFNSDESERFWFLCVISFHIWFSKIKRMWVNTAQCSMMNIYTLFNKCKDITKLENNMPNE